MISLGFSKVNSVPVRAPSRGDGDLESWVRLLDLSLDFFFLLLAPNTILVKKKIF
jgi:hypothetical protein